MNLLPLGQTSAGSNAAVITFVGYIAVVMLIAVASNRVAQSGSFLKDYFLGGRNLGMWAFALTFAATSASGGSFIGFPSLVYQHGWSVGLWICSYMLVPLVAMGLLAKRLNQVARKTDAITIPDLVRDRFNSPVLGLVATLLMVFFMAFNLIAQFKGGSVILQTLLSDVPLFQSASSQFENLLVSTSFASADGWLASVEASYLLCLLVFAFAVVLYTTYGGFRAVVWTDVLQGFVMVGGILVLLPMTVIAVGGLGNATRTLAARKQTTPVAIGLHVPYEDLSSASKSLPSQTLIEARVRDELRIFRLTEDAAVNEFGNVVSAAGNDGIAALRIDVTAEEIRFEPVQQGFILQIQEERSFVYGQYLPGNYTSLPGPSRTSDDGFLPLATAISFFFFWCFGSAGQPSNMIRCMAFRDTRTLARAIFTVSIYFSLIYFPIVIIFCCAQVLLPGWEGASDRIMPEMASNVTALFGVPWLAGLLVAAPFAAVMSTMDSFLLMISSSVVRDIYSRWINPHPTERRIKVLSYATTMIVGLGAMIAAVNPPQLLQDIIVFTGAGLATSFFIPIALALYWPRFNYQGALAGMLGGFVGNVALYAIGTWQTGKMSAYQPWGLHPFIIGFVASLLCAIVVCLVTAPPRQELVARFFYREDK